MTVLSRSVYVLAALDALIISFVTIFTFIGFVSSLPQLIFIVFWFLLISVFILYAKGYYNIRSYGLKDIYLLFEGITVSAVITSIPLLSAGFNLVTFLLLVITAIGVFAGILLCRLLFLIYLVILVQN